MSIDHQLLFCYLEEDNIQQAYFRVIPMLTPDADIREEAAALYPTQGALRIVPDRNEQHTFKTRMRSLGAFCLVDLMNLPQEATKIRSNKNFRPAKGEVNQFILYSDTVKPLPEHSFYQIVSGTAEQLSEVAKEAATPLFYLHEEGVLYGPIRRDDPVKPEEAAIVDGNQFTMDCPDGAVRTFLCLKDAPAPVPFPAPVLRKMKDKPLPEDPAQDPSLPLEPAPEADTAAAQMAAIDPEISEAAKTDEPLPLGESLTILDASKGHDETIRSLNKPVSQSANLLRRPERLAPMPPAAKEPLTGTPLVKTPVRTATPQPKNRTQEAVSSQWYIGKYEPPADDLPQSTAMSPVVNPVETACANLRTAWNSRDAQEQLIDCFLSLDGVRARLEPKITKDRHVTAMQRVLRDRLEDLEAERLSALCELDRARKDLDSYKQELIQGMSSRIEKETGKLSEDRDALQAQVASLKKEVNALTANRDELLNLVEDLQSNSLPAAMAKVLSDMQILTPKSGTALRMTPISGESADAEEMISRLMCVCEQCGLPLTRNYAIALLLLLAGSDRVGLVSTTPAPLGTMCRNIAASMGWLSSYARQTTPEQQPLVSARPVDATPAVMLTALPSYLPTSGLRKFITAPNIARSIAYQEDQFPILTLPSFKFIPELTPDDSVTPVSLASVEALLNVGQTPDADIDQVLTPILSVVAPLSGAARKTLYRFISAAAALMEGGLAVAVDWALTLWIVPALDRAARAQAEVRALFDEYPLALSKL